METLRDWLAEHPPADERFTQTVAGVATRVRAGEDLRYAVRELLDEFVLRGRDDLRARALAEEPENVDPHVDAYLKGFLSGTDDQAMTVLEVPGLRVLVASSRILLAMKVLAHRIGEDDDDVRLLARDLGLDDATRVLAVAETVYGDRLDAAARFFVEELFA